MIDYFYQLCWVHDAQSWLKSHCFSNLQPGNDQNQTTTTTTKHVYVIDRQEVNSARQSKHETMAMSVEMPDTHEIYGISQLTLGKQD